MADWKSESILIDDGATAAEPADSSVSDWKSESVLLQPETPAPAQPVDDWRSESVLIDSVEPVAPGPEVREPAVIDVPPPPPPPAPPPQVMAPPPETVRLPAASNAIGQKAEQPSFIGGLLDRISRGNQEYTQGFENMKQRISDTAVESLSKDLPEALGGTQISPTAELLMRRFFGNTNAMDEKRARLAVDALEDTISLGGKHPRTGEIGTAALQFVFDQLFMVPFLGAGVSTTQKAAKASETVLQGITVGKGKVVTSAHWAAQAVAKLEPYVIASMQGFKVGLIDYLLRPDTTAAAPFVGAAIGPAIHGVSSAAKAAVKAVRPELKATPKFRAIIADEAQDAFINEAKALAVQPKGDIFVKPKPPTPKSPPLKAPIPAGAIARAQPPAPSPVVQAKVSDPAFKPGVATVVEKDGGLVGRLIQIRPGDDARPPVSMVEMPVNTVSEAEAFRAAAAKKGLDEHILLERAPIAAHPQATELVKTLTPDRTVHPPGLLDTLHEKIVSAENKAPLTVKTDARIPELKNPPAVVTQTPDGLAVAPITSVQGKVAVYREAQAGDVKHVLPQELAGAKPRYAYGRKGFNLEFESDVDKALFILAQAKPSARDADYMDWARSKVGSGEFTDDQLRQLGQFLRNDIIKPLAKRSTESVLRIPAVTPVSSGLTSAPAPAANPIALNPSSPQAMAPPPPSAPVAQATPPPIPQTGAGGGIAPPPPPPSGPPSIIPEPPPHDPRVPLPGELSDADVADLGMIKTFGQMEVKRPGAIKRLLQSTVGGHARGPLDLAIFVNMQKSVKYVEASQLKLLADLEALFGKQATTEFRHDLLKLARGHIAPEHMEKHYGEVWRKGMEEVHALLRERDAWDEKLAELGAPGVPERVELRKRGLIPAYVARRTMARVLPPGEWKKIVFADEAIWKPMYKYIWDSRPVQTDLWAEAQTPEQVQGEIMALMDELLNAEDPIVVAGGQNSKNLNMLGRSRDRIKATQEMPWQLKNFLGENRDGISALAETIGSQRALAAQFTMMKEMAAKPEYVSATLTPQLHVAGWRQMPVNPHFGELSGKYVHPDLYTEMIDLPARFKNATNIWSAVVGWTKMNETIFGGAGPYMNSFMSNFQYGVYSGSLDLAHPVEAGKSFYIAAKMLYAHGKTSLTGPRPHTQNDALRELMEDAKRVGANISGFAATEIVQTNHTRLMNEYLKDLMLAPTNATITDRILHAGSWIVKNAKWSIERASAVFDLTDRIHRLSAWVTLFNRYETEGLTHENAMRLAARKVNESFPSPDRLGPSINNLVKNTPDIIARYGTYKAEAVRISLSLPSRLLKSYQALRAGRPRFEDMSTPEAQKALMEYLDADVTLPWRLASWALVGAGLFGVGGYVTTKFGGVPEEELQAIEHQISPDKRSYFASLHRLAWRNTNGSIGVWSPTRWFDGAAFLASHPDNAMWVNVMANFARMPFEGALTEVGINAGLEALGVAVPSEYKKQTRPGEEGILQLLAYVWEKTGVLPKAIPRYYNIAKQAGLLGPQTLTQEPLSPSNAALKAAGMPVVGSYQLGGDPTGEKVSPSFIQRLLAIQGEFNKLQQIINNEAKLDDEAALPMLQELKFAIVPGKSYKQTLIDAALARIDKLASNLQVMTTAQEAAWKARGYSQYTPPKLTPRR